MKAFLILSTTFLAAACASGQDLIWKSFVTNGDFNTATNWNPAQVPGSSSNVIFEQGTVPINVVSTNSSVNRVNRFTVQDATEVSLFLPVLTGNLIPLQIQGNLYLGPDAGDRAVLRLKTSSMSATSRATLGSGDGWGTWYLDSGTAAFVEGLTMGDSTLSKGSLFLDDAVFNHGSSSTSYVGNSGKGVLELDNGSNFDGDTLFHAAQTGSEATVKVDNGSTLDSNDVYIGGTDTAQGGTATIDVMGASAINAGFSMKIWSGGAVSVREGSSLKSRTLDNAGVLTLNSSSLTLQSPVEASLENTGTLNLTNSSVTTNRFVNRGSLNVTNTQLTIDNGLFDLGSTPQSLDVDASAFSSIEISGASASTANIANLYVGRSGSGTLIIGDSASFSNNTAYIGLGSSAVGSVSVSGGASWTNNGSLFVGNSGDGTLDADNGVIQTGNVLVGNNTGSTGSLTLANDSQLHAGTGNFTLGNSGTGSATLMIDETSFLHTGDLNINATGQLDLNGGEIWASSIVNNGGSLNFNHGSISIFGGTYDDGSGNLTVSSNAAANESLLIFEQSASPSYGTVAIGASNVGKLILQDNATLTSNLARVGTDEGYATVRDGATWNSNGLFLVGHSIDSYGELEIESTAAVTAERMFVGSGSSSSGVLRVTGGSLTVSSDQPDAGLYLGGNFNNPMGTATVLLNGTVDIEDTLKIWNTANVSIAGGTVRAHTVDNAAAGNLSHYGGELIVDGGAFLPDTTTLDVQGSATPTLTLDNGATLNVDQLDVGRSSGDGNLNIRNGSVVTTNSGRVGYSDANTGNVTVEGAGSTWSTQSLTFTGFFGQGNSHLQIDSGGSVVVTGDFEIVGSSFTATNGGTLEVGSLSKGDNTTVSISDSGTISALTIGAGGGSSSFNGTIADAAGGPGSITKTGSGSLELTGNNTYTGGTTVSEGTLIVNHTTGSATGTGAVTVDAGATLGGDGMIDGDVILAGILSPGNSPGAITIGGDLAMQPTSQTFIEIASLLDFDQISVGDNLSYDGELLLHFSIIPEVNDSFTIFDSFTSQSGAFDNIDFGTPDFDGTFDYATGALTLTAVPEPSTWALLFSALALGFAMCNKRRI